jgi:hypothetical protein
MPMNGTRAHEVSDGDWSDEVADALPAEGHEDPPVREEAGDETALREGGSDERALADEVARLASEEMRGTGGSF